MRGRKILIKWLGLKRHPLIVSMHREAARGHAVNWIRGISHCINSLRPEDRYWNNNFSKRVQKLARASRAARAKTARQMILGEERFSEVMKNNIYC